MPLVGWLGWFILADVAFRGVREAVAMSEPKTDEVPMVNVQINGVWKRFPKGTRMIEACRQAGVEVPHYCYHPKLTSPGELPDVPGGDGDAAPPGTGAGAGSRRGGSPKVIQWMPRPAIACANTVAEGMGIRTESELAETCRKGVMEFLLINHPLDCPICDQAGECRLQEFERRARERANRASARAR